MNATPGHSPARQMLAKAVESFMRVSPMKISRRSDVR